MRRLVDVTVRNDGLVGDMAERANSLVRLTDEARERQHESNADIVKSLAERDRKLRLARDIVDRGHEFDSRRRRHGALSVRSRSRRSEPAHAARRRTL